MKIQKKQINLIEEKIRTLFSGKGVLSMGHWVELFLPEVINTDKSRGQDE